MEEGEEKENEVVQGRIGRREREGGNWKTYEGKRRRKRGNKRKSCISLLLLLFFSLSLSLSLSYIIPHLTFPFSPFALIT